MTAFRLALVSLLLATTATADPLRVVSVPTNDLAYDPVTHRIYASVPSSGGSIGNSITAIDPETGQVGTSVFVGSEPGELAMSDQGRSLYVSLDGAAAVRRFDTVTQTAGLQFTLGTNYGPDYAEDLAVLPGQPDAVAVSKYNKGISPRHVNVTIYDNGVPRPKVAAGANVIAFGATAARLYGYHNETTDFTFVRWNVDATGIVSGDGLSLLSGFGQRILFDGGRIYGTNGGVYDPEAGTLLGTLPGGAIRPDSKLGRVFILNGDGANVQLSAYDATTFLKLWSAKIPGVNGGVGSLIRWGADGLAFRTGGGQVFLLHTGEISVAPPSFTLTLHPATAAGEATVTGTVTLGAAAPAAGATVLLSTSDPAATSVPPQVVVPAGATTATFPVKAHSVAAPDDVTISATYGGATHTAALHLVPPPAANGAQLLLFPNPVPGGLLALGQVILPQPAGPGGEVVSLTSHNPAAAVAPASITVLPGASAATFPIITFAVSQPAAVPITAGGAFGTATAVLQVLPLGSLPPPVIPATNLLVNGSFEAPHGDQFGVSSGVPGWQILKGDIDILTNSYWQAAPDGGNQSIDLDGFNVGTIQQSFATVPGQEYLFSGYVSHNPSVPYGRADVSLNGVFFTQLTHAIPNRNPDMQWQPFSYRFQATAATTTLTLSDVTGINTSQGTVLDGLSVMLAPGQNPPGITPPTGLPAPTNLSAQLLIEARVQLAWTPHSTDEDGFAIWRQTPTRDWAPIGVAPPHATTFLDPGVSPSTAYRYRVRATRGRLTSDWSNEAALTTPAAPSAPMGLRVELLGTTLVSLTWSADSSNATAMTVFRQTAGGGWTLVGERQPYVRQFTDRGLIPNTRYSYRVVAHNNEFVSGGSNEVMVTTLGP